MDNDQINEDSQQDKPFESQNNIPNDNVSNIQTDPTAPEKNYVVQPDPTPQPVVKPSYNSPGVIVLQWLTYAFWGGTVIAMSTLTALVLTFFIAPEAVTGDSSLYVMAAVLVLLPISVICDFFYMKQEPEKKTGFASILVIIYSIFFALFGVAAFIVATFSTMNLIISSSNTEGTRVALYSSLIIAFLFVILFLRTILLKKLFKMRRYFIILMVVIVGIICAFGIFGPVADARLRRNDTLIENNLSIVSESVNAYVTKNSQLPNSLGDLKLSGDSKKLVTDNLVTYTKDASPKLQSNNLEDYSSTYSSAENYYYQLCVTYKMASQYQSEYSQMSSGPTDNGYDTYLSTSPHPAGEKCYKLMTTNDSYNYNSVPLSSSSS